MERKDFLKTLLAFSVATPLTGLRAFTDTLARQNKEMPVLFTSHGSPMDITKTVEERRFWKALSDLGKSIRNQYDVKAVLVVSAHWCSNGTFVNISPEQKQIYDFTGFPPEYYKVKYQANGAPEIAKEVSRIIPSIAETTDWGLDHGSWPMLMHLFPEADVPVFQMSIDYYASPTYHYELGRELKSLRNKGVLIIGSGALVHNIPLSMKKYRDKDPTPYGWEAEYDEWIAKQIEQRNLTSIIDYQNSHKLGKLAAPTPDHFVPVLYSLGLLDKKDDIRHFYEYEPTMPAFTERSFVIGSV